MATFNKGILGGFRGKVGNVVGFFWKGQAVMRSLAGSVANPKTYAQLVARARFALAGSLMSSCTTFTDQTVTIPTSFSSTERRKSKINIVMQRALAALQANSQDPTSPLGYDVDFQNFVIDEGYGDGTMLAPSSANVQFDSSTRNLQFAWSDQSATIPTIGASDVITLVAIPSTRKADGLFQFRFGLMNDGDFERRDQAGTLYVPEVTGLTFVECYIIAHNQGNSQRSTSFYCGQVAIS